MFFHSFEFFVFLPTVFFLYWFAFRNYRWQNLLIVIASYIFYGWWDWRFLILIALTSAYCYGSGLLLEKYRKSRLASRAICASSIVLNLSILGVFKYCNFFVENLSLLFDFFGFDMDWGTINLILPVGISFYTFQALSYTIDVYRGKISATRSVIDFFAFISFFPQLVAGPIERATTLLPQFQKNRRFDYALAVDGCRQMLWGFFKKMVVADNCAGIVNQIWAGYAEQTGLVLLVGGILFAMQIYCDFSGYSDIAIGCARLFDISLMRNFDFPYFARSIPDFWRRWHISLTDWFRDYVYFPLGGSRCGKWKFLRNVYVVWAISGLWHGAKWTFVCWGLFHAALLVSYRFFGLAAKRGADIARSKPIPSFKEAIQICVTFFLVVIGWIVFRSQSMAQAFGYIASICDRSFFDLSASLSQIWELKILPLSLAIFFFMLVEWLQRDKQHALQFPADAMLARHAAIRYAFYLIFAMLIIACAGTQSEFIYFQF